MNKIKRLTTGLVLAVFCSVVMSDENATLNIKTKQWISKSSLSKKSADYYLDVYAVDSKDAEPDINQRSPAGFFRSPKKSKHFVGSLILTGKENEARTIQLPKGKYVYLSSYFYQGGGLLIGDPRYCNVIETILPSEDEYVLDTNFVSTGLVSGHCRTTVHTIESYARSFSNIREASPLAGVSRKELSLLYASRIAVRLTAVEISQQNDYLVEYLDVAVDRLLQEANSDEKNSAIASLCQIIRESGSEAHIVAMGKIAKVAKHKHTIKTIRKNLPKTIPDHPPYTPKPIGDISGQGLSFTELAALAAKENLKSSSKFELEAAARDIVATPSNYDLDTYTLAEKKMLSIAGSKENQNEASSIWMMRVLQASGDKRFVDSITMAEKAATHRKVKAAARKAIKALTGAHPPSS